MKIYLATQIIINDSQDKSLTNKKVSTRLLSYMFLKNERERSFEIF